MFLGGNLSSPGCVGSYNVHHDANLLATQLWLNSCALGDRPWRRESICIGYRIKGSAFDLGLISNTREVACPPSNTETWESSIEIICFGGTQQAKQTKDKWTVL